jgi:hypothetical protein
MSDRVNLVPIAPTHPDPGCGEAPGRPGHAVASNRFRIRMRL